MMMNGDHGDHGDHDDYNDCDSLLVQEQPW